MFARYAVSLHSRCESLLDKLRIPILEAQPLDSSTNSSSSPLFLMAESCIKDVAVNRFAAVLAAMIFYDFQRSNEQGRVTDYVRAVLKHFLDPEEAIVEEEVCEGLAIWETEIQRMIDGNAHLPEHNPATGKDISTLSSNELRSVSPVCACRRHARFYQRRH